MASAMNKHMSLKSVNERDWKTNAVIARLHSQFLNLKDRYQAVNIKKLVSFHCKTFRKRNTQLGKRSFLLFPEIS